MLRDSYNPPPLLLLYDDQCNPPLVILAITWRLMQSPLLMLKILSLLPAPIHSKDHSYCVPLWGFSLKDFLSHCHSWYRTHNFLWPHLFEHSTNRDCHSYGSQSFTSIISESQLSRQFIEFKILLGYLPN